MSHLRILVAWLVLLAFPFQGFAAVTMAMCAGGHHAPQAATQQHDAHAGHDHASHAHAAQASDDQAQPLPDAAHKCSICASCCHGVALTPSGAWPQLVPLERATLAEPFVAVRAAAGEVPDKPPRS